MDNYSIVLHMDAELAEQLTVDAKKQGVSLNAHIVNILDAYNEMRLLNDEIRETGTFIREVLTGG